MAKRYTKKQQYYRDALLVLRHGFIDPFTGKRTGKLAHGFDPASGYDLHNIDDWTPAQKAKITRYFKEVDQLASRPFKLYRARNKKNLKAVQAASQHGHLSRFPDLAVAFVPVADPAKGVDIKIKKNRVVFTQSGVESFPIYFDMRALAADPEREIARALDAAPKAKRYQIQAGRHVIAPVYDRGIVEEEVIKLMNRYSTEDANNYFGNWLHGVVGLNYGGPSGLENRAVSKEQRKEQLRKARQRERARRRKLWGKARAKGRYNN